MTHVNILVNINKFEPIEALAEGGFGDVYKVRDKDSGEIYAAKVSKFPVNQDFKDDEITFLLFREVNLLAALNHPSVIKFIAYCSTDFDREPNPTIITQFAPRGSLQDIIENSCNQQDSLWDDTKKLINIYGIASGMMYLHSHDIIHRDLKPANILMDEKLQPKISDFGISKISNFTESFDIGDVSTIPNKGTEVYKPPEVHYGEEFTKASDVYAYGLIVYQIMENKPNIIKKHDYKALVNMAFKKERPQFSQQIPEPYKNLIEKCWDHNPENRPTFEEITKELKKCVYITDNVDEDAFCNYIESLEEHSDSFNLFRRSIKFDEFIQGKIKTRKRSNAIITPKKPFNLLQKIASQNECPNDMIGFRNKDEFKLDDLYIEIDADDTDSQKRLSRKRGYNVTEAPKDLFGKVEGQS